MDRESKIYKIRRKLQVIAHKIFSDKVMSKIYYRIVLGKKLNIDNPITFNEKLQYLKLNNYPNNQKVIQCADKFRVRDYIKEKGLEQYLTKFLGVWDSPDEINWDNLPNKFVLKCNHGCAYNIICNDKKTFDKAKANKQLKKWLKEDFGAFNIEIQYSKIKKHLIICEEFLGDCITDYKFFCFNGEPKFFYVSTNLINDREACMGHFNMDGSKLSLVREGYKDIKSIKLPDFYNDMVEISKILSKDFPFVRVDFFIANNRFYFAELTFTPGGCMMNINPEKYDYEWGKLLEI